jgi:hypothetical protein
MSTADRVAKYYDDGKDLVGGGNSAKIMSEIRKLATYLQKHQTEAIAEGAKTKLFGTVEMYYRYAKGNLTNEAVVDCVSSLLSAYLQLPEGKLVSATHKKKVLQWAQDFTSGSDSAPSSGGAGGKAASVVTTWSVEGVNDDGSLTLLSAADSELWKENFMPVNLKEYITTILTLQEDAAGTVLVDLDEQRSWVVNVRASS